MTSFSSRANKMLAFLILVGACQALTPAAGAESLGVFSFVVENDLFYGLDQHYTNGLRLLWVPDGEAIPPKWARNLIRKVPWFRNQGTLRHGYAFGQSMFTPSDITVAKPPSDERPYAGWLYSSIGLGVESGKVLDLLALTVGMVGPSALAKQGQKFIHEISDSDEPQGWDTQLANEPGIMVTYQHSWRALASSTFTEGQMDVTPHVGAVVGNVFTYGNLGLTLRFGKRLPNDYGPPRIQPGSPGSGDFSPVSHTGWYFFVGVEGRAVARNIFLDGNTFYESSSVTKEPLVGDVQFGYVFDWRRYRLCYTHVLRTREYQTQASRDDFGAFSITVRL